jgi:serine/threonine protein kinase
MAEEQRFISLEDLELLETIGTVYSGVGNYGRVRLCRVKQAAEIFALKIMKKDRLIRTKQVDHVKSEKRLLEQLSHPFICHL